VITAQIENSLNTLNSPLSLYIEREREKEREGEREREREREKGRGGVGGAVGGERERGSV
jgi:hypothetical protein